MVSSFDDGAPDYKCASRDLLCTALDQGPVYEASVASECWDWGLTVPLRETS
ncbi:hypothetical protein FGIG_09795 [Fasciola gigantica]|uniref:Uncharacterized protein n=1 Tax=Fasciola gigantica TaxID=46835 RepID=A0A504YZB7_FASGI|nr:hypothetical protein FGIG_09795 [Fasciola gigantica]